MLGTFTDEAQTRKKRTIKIKYKIVSVLKLINPAGVYHSRGVANTLADNQFPCHDSL